MFKKTLFIMLAIYLGAMLAIYIDSHQTELSPSDYAIVFGNKVNLDGRPSKRLQARLDAALILLNKKLVKKILVSGGVGKEGFDEAQVMKDYLISHGVTKDNILMDSDGYNTHKTSIHSFKLIGSQHSVVAVTQQYHISRSKLSLKHAGFTQVTGYYPEYYELRDGYGYSREVLAWLKYWIFDL